LPERAAAGATSSRQGACHDAFVLSSDTATLLRRPGFVRYATTVAAVRATGTMFSVAGVLLILQRTHDLALAGVVVAASTLPAALTGPFLGGWLDVTHNRRRLLVLDRVVTAIALAAILLLAGNAPNWLLPIAAAVYGLTSPLSAGAFSAVLPEVAGPDLLGLANAFEAASINVAFIVGPALAGLIAGIAGPAAAVEVQLLSGLVLAGLIAADDTFELRPVHRDTTPGSVREAVREGLSAIWRITTLRWNMLVDCIYVLAWGTLFIGFPVYAVSLGTGAHASGYLWASISAGSMIGGFALSRRAAAPSSRLLIVLCFFAVAAAAAVWPLIGSMSVALLLVFVTGLFDGPALVGLISIRQRAAPAHLRAQIFTTASSVHFAVIAIGQAAAGIFHQAFGTTATLLLFPLLIVLAGATSLLMRPEAEGSTVTTRSPIAHAPAAGPAPAHSDARVDA
jgi:MFS family permease